MLNYAKVYGFTQAQSRNSAMRIAGQTVELTFANLSFSNANSIGYSVEVTVNGHIYSDLIAITYKNANSYKLSIIPVYSNSIKSTESASFSASAQVAESNITSNVAMPSYSYSQVQNVYSTGWFGWFLSFNEAATVNLETDMTALSILLGYLSFILGSFVVAAFITFLAAALLAVGVWAIQQLDASGGYNGFYMDGPYGAVSGWGTPWTAPVPWWA